MLTKILAPFDGWCGPLDEVPDEVFAGRMLGDGLAIDPTSALLLAPCAGEVVTLPTTAHAVSLRTAEGLEVLVHIGIDTVELKGRGFEALVGVGAKVEAGRALIRFDLDAAARGAKSLMTPIVIQSDGAVVEQRRPPGPVAGGEVLFEVRLRTPILAAPSALPTPVTQRDFKMPLQQGLHARPAALIAQRARAFQSELTARAHGRSANARSVVALMALGLRCGDDFAVTASGADAGAAIEGIAGALDEARRLEAAHGAKSPAAPAVAAVAPAVPRNGALVGITAVPGFGIGRATRIERRTIEVAERGGSQAHERAELDRAQSDVRARLTRMANAGGATRREIIKAHLEFLEDPSLNAAAHESIGAGYGAGFAWRAAVRQSIQALELLDDTRLRERADDLLDIESHVLMALVGEAKPMILPLPERAVLVAADLLPSELTALDRQRLVGICLSGGGATSHVAILAAAMEIPMLVGLGSGVREIADGTTVIIDADHGRLETTPNEAAMRDAHAQVETRLLKSAEHRAAAQADCHAQDGTRVEVFANLGNVIEAAVAVDNGAEGCGLLRSEFLFIDRDAAPGEEEQFQAYQDIAAALNGRPLILRLMDVGGDKPLRYLPMPHEDNPALGLRGVRTVLARPELLRTQLSAALRVTPAGRLKLLLPMVTDIAEILAVRAVCDELRQDLKRDAVIEIGAMIETPAAALTAARLLREVDFLSIGSNDLTQYALAMDRGHPQLAGRTDALHPAVLKLIAAAAAAGVAAGKLVAVCGGMAAERAAVPLLLGLGVRELSVVPGAIPATKRRVRALRILECRDLALRCLELGSAAEVRALVAQHLAALGDLP